eukprot:scaffold3124_cov390-Prasinococcus_capsulatus_cf.AAC.5
MRQRSGNAGSFEHDPEDALHGSREALPMLTAPDGAVLGVLPSHHAAYSHYMGEFGSAPGPNGLGEGGPGAPALYTAARGTAAGSAGYNKLHKPLRRKSAVAGRRLPRWALWSILALAALNCLQWVLSRHQAVRPRPSCYISPAVPSVDCGRTLFAHSLCFGGIEPRTTSSVSRAK